MKILKNHVKSSVIYKAYKKIQNRIENFSLPEIGKVCQAIMKILHIRAYCIVRIEGGITSQMEQYVLGCRLKELGYNVKYDLTFYKNGKGKDCLGINARNFDIQQVDRNIIIDSVSRLCVRFYKILFSFSRNACDCERLNSNNLPIAPVYLDGYGYGLYRENEFEKSFVKNIKINFSREIFGEKNCILYDEICLLDNSVGVHVRRGDILLPIVGRPIPRIEYYLRALSYFDNSIPIYIFSDDKEWVRNELIPNMSNQKIFLVDENDSSCGWKDLILLSACKNQIKSPAGGMGRDAFRLNTNFNKTLIRPVYVEGNHVHMDGNIIDIVLDDELCDMTNVIDRSGVL